MGKERDKKEIRFYRGFYREGFIEGFIECFIVGFINGFTEGFIKGFGGVDLWGLADQKFVCKSVFSRVTLSCTHASLNPFSHV